MQCGAGIERSPRRDLSRSSCHRRSVSSSASCRLRRTRCSTPATRVSSGSSHPRMRTTPRRRTSTGGSSGRACSTASWPRSASWRGRHASDRLTEAELESWLGALESLRLVVGTQLDITEESYGFFDPADPDAPRLALYHWLSWLQEEVVQALASALPPDEAAARVSPCCGSGSPSASSRSSSSRWSSATTASSGCATRSTPAGRTSTSSSSAAPT